MLQQTQVRRVEPKYLEFMERWSTPENLTQSQLSDVLKFWVGLGYPRRARNLYDAAHQIVDVHSGVVPSTLPQLMELPGVGPYT
ncbi:MAG: A/G-specific adenine glycosylase, partial [Acidimicrobiales bacterium]|nr:A/G-specific adenine glycosylase [Acidimicrobiales bacterium]